MNSVITTPDHVTPKYLTEVLRNGGFLERGHVVGVKTKLTKSLFVSTVSRLEAEYSPEAPADAPTAFFLKVSKPDVTGGGASGVNRSEVEFYRSVASEMDAPPLIRCYDAAYCPETDRSHLLLEDLSESHFQPASPEPPSESYSELAVDCLAALHAFWWEHPRLGRGIGKLFEEGAKCLFR